MAKSGKYNKQYHVEGKVVAIQKSRFDGSERTVVCGFDRTVYAQNVEQAVCGARMKLLDKHGKSTRLYEVVMTDILDITVYEMVHEWRNENAYKRVGLPCEEVAE